MKKQYIAPQIEIERYDLSVAIATCGYNWGPTVGAQTGCSNEPESGPFWADVNQGGLALFYTVDVNNCKAVPIGGKDGFSQSFPGYMNS